MTHFVVLAIELLQGSTERDRHVLEHQLVDLCATESLERLRRADQRGSGFGQRDNGGIERAAEVVDRNGVASRDPPCRRVTAGGGDRLAHQLDVNKAERRSDRSQQLELVSAPRGRVGEHQRCARGVDA